MQDDKSLIPHDDLEYERQLRVQEAEERALAQKLDEERRAADEKARADYEKGLQDRKIELMKLRQGVIESSDTVKEVHEELPPLTLRQKLEGAWYRSKWLIIFVVVLVAAFGYITLDSILATKPDYTVLVISSDTALYYRTPEVQAFFENYSEDINGDGKVNVLVYNISTDYSNANMSQSSQAQLMSQLQSGENVLILSDQPTDFAMIDFREQYPDSEQITELGLLINCQLTRDALKWEAMPDGLYLGVRSPARLLSTSAEDMQENVDKAMPVFEKIKAAVEASEK